MKNKILALLLVIISVAIGLTAAYFSDMEKSESNVFSAGILDLTLGQPSEAVWRAENWLPGDEKEGELELKNDGSLPIESLLISIEIE